MDGSNINVELAPQDIYSGMYGRVTLNFFAFNSNGNKGIGCGLGNVLKTKDGEPLAGGSTAAQDFEGVSVPAPAPVAAPAPTYAPGVVPQAAPAQAYAPGVVPQAAPAQQGYTPAAGYMNVPQQIDPITGAPLNPLPFN